jgi:hypothetical protein
MSITSSIQTEIKISDTSGNLISYPIAGEIKVKGSLIGEPGREVQLTAQETSNLFKFKEWIVETIPIALEKINVGAYTSTIEEMCSNTAFTLFSAELYTDGNFFYIDNKGENVARTGFYGAGGNTYYSHNSTQGKLGPFTCPPTETQTSTTQGSSGGGGGGGQSPNRLFRVDDTRRGTIDEQEDTARGPIAEE